MVEESKDLTEYKTTVARKRINNLYFSAGIITGATITSTIIMILLERFINLNPELLGVLDMIIKKSPETRAMLDTIVIIVGVFFVVGLFLYYLAIYYENKISKGDLSFIE